MIAQLGARLLGRFSVPWQVRIVIATGLVVINLVAVLILQSVTELLIPFPPGADPETLRARNALLSLIGLVAGTAIILLASRSLMQRIAGWLVEERVPDEDERLALLYAPAGLFALNAVLWGLGASMFGLVNARTETTYGVLLASQVALAGVIASAMIYLVAERALRPMTRRALAHGVPERVIVPSVAARSMVAWALSSGVSMLGVGIVGFIALFVEPDVTRTQLATSMLILGFGAFIIGGLTNLLAANASSDPVRSLRLAVARVREGDLATHVDIYDGTEIGVLQAGFNDMVSGLREREKIHDLFGKHVGRDVAREALEEGVRFGGEVRQVTVLFVDIMGSTTMATDRPPNEVVALLNRFFDVVIDVVHEYRGWINKFEGDAALAIWGAPVAVPAQESLALAAARVMGERLASEVPDLTAGIGVSCGRAVAGNVGAAERYEYTVIGDPVNEAARLSELAKSVPGYVVANAMLVDRAYVEGERWQRLDPVLLRGRDQPTGIAVPRRPEQAG